MSSGSASPPGSPGSSHTRRSPSARVRRTRLLALAILAVLGLAVLAPAGQASETEAEGAQRAAKRESAQAQREAKRESAAQRAAERRARREQHKGEHQARAEERSKTRGIHLGHKTDTNAEVEIDCNSITVRYFGFHAVEGHPNSVLQLVVMRNQTTGLRIEFPPKTFTFEGTEATSVIPIAAPVGPSTVDLRSKWNTNEVRGGFDIHQSVKCEPKPQFTIAKLQSLGGPFTSETLTGAVGQTVLYQMIVTNTGNTPLTFSGFTDTVCDPGTIGGMPIAPIEPLGSFMLVCAHKITTADVTGGSIVNVATITGTPEEDEGAPVTEESNHVVVTPKEEEGKEKEKEEEKEEEKGKEEPKTPPTTTPTTPTTPPKSGVLGTSGASSTSTSKSGVLGFASATVPSLRGPQGCVRSAFTASIKSAGVSSVIFYLDGQRLKRLTASAARKGVISISINASKLKVGAHHVKAAITMKPTAAGAKATKANRSLTVVRCRSAVIAPHFTG